MISGILFIVILKMLEAPTWCFVLAWIGIILNCFGFLGKIYKLGKENAKNE